MIDGEGNEQSNFHLRSKRHIRSLYCSTGECASPAVVVLHEAFGINADIREKCDELAERGFIGVASN